METSDLLRCVCVCVCVCVHILHAISLYSMPHNDLLEGAIVLEEFIKVCKIM